MREILFRGRSKPYNETHQMDEWLYGDIVRLADGKAVYSYIYGKGEVDPETVGQYTGLTDKNGKKIFEGDIIRFEENLYTVQRECDTPGGYWAETGYILNHIGWSDYISFTSTIDDWENECQVFVVGNIYDNPELLKGEE